MIDVANIAKAAASAVQRVLDGSDSEAVPVRSMVLMTAADLNGDANAVREWFAEASDDTAVAAFVHYCHCLFYTVNLWREAANSDTPEAAESREMVKDMAAFIRTSLAQMNAEHVVAIGETLTSAGWKTTLQQVDPYK
jgi:hypothetical protein